MGQRHGISLIVLIITIIIIIILSAVILVTINKNNPVDSAKEAVFRQDIRQMQEELELYNSEMLAKKENPKNLNANRKSDPSIQQIIESMTDKYAKILEIKNGELVYIGKNKSEYIIAKEIGLLPEGVILDDDILTDLKSFITEWTVEDGESITLPIAGTCNFNVDYGDGTGEYKITSSTDENRIHTYEKAGTYTVKITGKCGYINFYDGDNAVSRDKITKLVQWGSLGEGLTSNEYSFYNCKNLTGPIPLPSSNTFKNVKSCKSLFNGCSSLTGSIPSGLFKGAKKIESFAIEWGLGAFNGCENLTGSIPGDLFSDCVNAKNFSMTFYGCKGLTGPIPEELFENCKNITNIAGYQSRGLFKNCSGLTGQIPENLFKNCSKVTTYSGVFSGCTGLTGSIPENLFSNSPNVTNFKETFFNCSNLSGDIPEKLFATCPNVTDFSGTFVGCKNISSIPANLFSNNSKVTTFSSTFSGCEKIYTIPSELFKNNTLVTNFNETFIACKNVLSIPAELFSYCPKVTTFAGVFKGCISLKSVPEGLFDNNTMVTSFGKWWCGAFQECSNLVSVPNDLFKYNTEVTNFGFTFLQCKKLKNIPDLSNNVKTTDFGYMFCGCANAEGKFYPIWNFTSVTSFGKCFIDCKKLSNYSEIPASWK
mgnify:CR=1 FL=1